MYLKLKFKQDMKTTGCNVLKPRKVCEQSELRLQNIDPIKRGRF